MVVFELTAVIGYFCILGAALAFLFMSLYEYKQIRKKRKDDENDKQ